MKLFYVMVSVAMAYAVLLMVACTPPTPAPPPAAPTIYKADWPQGMYTDYVVEAFTAHGSELLKLSPPGICGDKLQFYIMLISALARFESNFDTNAKYVEKFPDAKGKSVVSRGLLQMSIESGNGNYGCGFKTENDLHDAKQNLACGVRAMAKLIGQDKVIAGGAKGAWKGMARYWSPFRDEAKKKVILDKARAAACP